MADGPDHSAGRRDALLVLAKLLTSRELERKKGMKDKLKTTASAETVAATDAIGKTSPQKPAPDEPRAAINTVRKIDRPGFDLGGSSGDTHAGTGLGLGVDASDTAGDRRLPGRRLDNKLTIPRWNGPETESSNAPFKKTKGTATRSAPQAKKPH